MTNMSTAKGAVSNKHSIEMQGKIQEFINIISSHTKSQMSFHSKHIWLITKRIE